jgi:peptidoglycan/xylan/chitin deacetylase (PgdA/CDA1 family)
MNLRMCAPRLIAPSISLLMLIGCGPIGGMGQAIGVGGAFADSGASAGGAGASASAGTSAGGASAGEGGFAGEAPLSNVGQIQVEGVSVWKGNATAAYSIIHDDACDYPLDSLFTTAEPALTARGLRAAFGAIVERCQERNVWDKLRVMVAHGHEIVCHSWTHPDFIDDNPDLSVQIDQATQVLAQNLPEQKVQYFIFPYDSFTQPMIDHLAQVGYTGARAGTKGVNPPNFPDPLRGDFDVYNDENSIYYPAFSDVLKAYVDDAISKGGWAIREFHGVQDASWETVPTADYEAHLDYIKEKSDAGDLWVDTPSAVGHYRFARQFCGMPAVDGAQLTFPEPSAQCTANATALSVIVQTEVDAQTLTATQGSQSLPTQRLAEKRFLIEMDPTLGRVVLHGE